MTTGKAWTAQEIEIITAAYAVMLRQELDGIKFNKSATRREVVKLLDGRSEGSYELKMMNISAACKDAGLPFINGYKPLPAYQAALKPAIIQHCKEKGITRFTADVAAACTRYITYLHEQSPIIGTSHFMLNTLYMTYGKEVINKEVDRQFSR